MSKKPTRRQQRAGLSHGDQFVIIPYKMLRSDAWRSLGGPAVKVWLELRTRYHGGNNGKLVLSMRDATELLGMSKTTVQRAYEELTAKGFLKLAKKGHWYGRMANEWETTDKDRDGTPATNDWRLWQKPPAKPKKQKAVPIWDMPENDGTA